MKYKNNKGKQEEFIESMQDAINEEEKEYQIKRR